MIKLCLLLFKFEVPQCKLQKQIIIDYIAIRGLYVSTYPVYINHGQKNIFLCTKLFVIFKQMISVLLENIYFSLIFPGSLEKNERFIPCKHAHWLK